LRDPPARTANLLGESDDVQRCHTLNMAEGSDNASRITAAVEA
jgi:hypothetical protein